MPVRIAMTYRFLASSDTSFVEQKSRSQPSLSQQSAVKTKDKPSFFKRLTSRSSTDELEDHVTSAADLARQAGTETKVRTSVRLLSGTRMVQRRLENIGEQQSWRDSRVSVKDSRLSRRDSRLSRKRYSLDSGLQLSGSINDDIDSPGDRHEQPAASDVIAATAAGDQKKRVMFYAGEDDDSTGAFYSTSTSMYNVVFTYNLID